jgi:hypothetical protein
VSDDELITELRDLAPWLAVPPAADQTAAVRRRLTVASRRRLRVRVWIASVVAAAAGTVAAVAPARAAVVDAVGDLLRVAGVEVDRSPRTEPLPTHASPLPSLRAVSLSEARQVALFPVRVPSALGAPERVELIDPDPAGAPRVVTLIYRGGAVRLDQFDGDADPTFFKSAPQAEFADVGDGNSLAVWLPAPHAVTYVGRDGVQRTETARLATPTLLWTTGSRTYRLEGLTSREEAERIARSLS